MNTQRDATREEPGEGPAAAYLEIDDRGHRNLLVGEYDPDRGMLDAEFAMRYDEDSEELYLWRKEQSFGLDNFDSYSLTERSLEGLRELELN